MASAAAKAARTEGDLDRVPVRVVRLIRLATAGGLAYAAYKIQWRAVLASFFTGPGRISRILMLFFALLNLKNMPFVWTYRVWHAIIFHLFIRKSPRLGPRSLFRPIISQSHAPITEIDYNVHKSNSTYFSDLDVSRTHLCTYLLRPGFRQLAHNPTTKLVLDPKSGLPARGGLGIILGAVHCSFRREITAYAPYEMWSRVLAWDRKWLYIVTHFVPKGTARPAEWLDPKFGGRSARVRKGSGGSTADSAEWEKKIYATGVSKYVLKIGRLTVHPAVALEASELLPQRPGGWQGGDSGVGDEEVDLSDVQDDGAWDWKMVEKRRREGMVYARQFAAMDDLHGWLDGADGGDGSALGKFGLG
ncbi:putative thioesterase atnL [Colletotrichum orbiculare MAFF 240422]|uniref:Thioesterase atnL n=1 Tax=Colletotrichum orbiculare (strain 104-T / ATCC 96160 / CBS 514.97 / LARS 414 / MAFF 240422) TaxID=1213857 RepID=N4VMG7_COLOR|nr:putative thioesterase atnL [Colletotrichum orbiculare MAFF 240422]